MDMMEIFKPVRGYEGLYEISNRGRVKSLQKRIGGRRKPITVYRELILKTNNNGNGYLQVSLCKDGKRKQHFVHRLVAEAFCDNPNGCNVVNHIDADRQNNSAANLEWCTTAQNVAYAAPHMRHEKSRSKATSSGEKYIQVRYLGGSEVRYEVSIRNQSSRKGSVHKRFPDLQSAVEYRNFVLAKAKEETGEPQT